MKFTRTAIWTRWIICGLLVITASADFLSFAIEDKFQAFDMSLLTIATKNIWLILLVKYLVIFGMVYLLIGVKSASDYWRFLWLMMAVYLIIFQTIGTINNRQVAAANPPVESAPSVEVRAATGINFAMVWAYYPIGFSMLCFWLWNLGWRLK